MRKPKDLNKDKYIKALVEKWRPRLFLGEWNIFCHVSTDAGAASENNNQLETAAEISVNYPYKTAHITVYKGFWDHSKDYQDSIICHELCHCHTQELWDFLTNFQNGKHHTPDEVWRSVETLTQRISIIAKHK